MNISGKRTFKDDWLAQALLYYQIIDKSLYQELLQRYAAKSYLFDVMVEKNYLSAQDISEFIESALKITAINLEQTKIDPAALEGVPEEVCHKYLFIPVAVKGNEIHIASFNPSNLNAEQEIESLTGKYVKTFFAFKDQIQQKITAHYSPDKLIDSLVGGNKKRSKIRIPGEETVGTISPVVKLVNQIFADAIDGGSSDIHIEPKEHTADVRIRIDGVLQNLIEIPKAIYPSLVSRIKIISDLNIAETRKPQDGKAKIYVDEADVDLRVSALPTNYGEKVVIRILDRRSAAVSLDKMGIRGKNRELLETCFKFKQGMVLVTGPTGSGKSTTLYAAINRIKSTSNNILTVEDPIEYNMEGINQVQVNVKAGVTFASALRSFLRQDPDVILVGEVRDGETAEIAIQAAQTGHLVLSTLHTNDTFATITRLRDMGVDKFKITESLQAVVAQRLVRRLCPDCKAKVDEEHIDPKLQYMLDSAPGDGDIYEAKGCQTCSFTGYKGRVGIYEILILDSTLKTKINSGAPLTELRTLAKKNGFQNLFEDALSLISEGITDYNEVLRTVNPDSNKNSDNKLASQKVQQEKELAKPEHEAPVVSKPEPVPEAPRPTRILIVEDYEVSRKMLRVMVEKHTEWEVEEAEDGVDALEKIKKSIPDVILLDIMMPRMDGYELLQHLRAEPETMDVPVLILTGMKTSESEVKSLEMGGDDYLTKPIRREVLIARVKRILDLKKKKTAQVVTATSPSPSPLPSPPPVAQPPAKKPDPSPNQDFDAKDFKLI